MPASRLLLSRIGAGRETIFFLQLCQELGLLFLLPAARDKHLNLELPDKSRADACA